MNVRSGAQFVHTRDILLVFKNTSRAVPELQDSASFMVTEAVEVLDETLRMKPEYRRNHPRPSNITKELGDTYMMLLLTAMRANVDLELALAQTLEGLR